MASSNPSTPRGRQRTRTACIPCRQRKRKCDSNLPCNMCSVYEYTCKYPKEGRKNAKKIVQLPSNAESRATAIQRQSPVAGSSLATNGHLVLSVSGIEANSPSSPLGQQGILDPVKTRYMNRHSAIAFPRSLGIDLQSPHPPSLHSFAYNCGVRPEEKGSITGNLLALIAVEDLNRYTEVYFSVVHPYLGVLDQKHFTKRCDAFLKGETHDLVFEAVISGVVALGSFFSLALCHPREADIMSNAKSILEDSAIARVPSIDHVLASLLRVIYLRATTRPHMAWMQSCTTLHLVEATGLHHERHAVSLTTENGSEHLEVDQEGTERARRIFWYSWAIHVIISYEYGRSSVVLGSITCTLPRSNNDFVHIAQLLPKDHPIPSPTAQRAEIERALEQLLAIPDSHPMVTMTKADMSFCFYRRLHMTKVGISKSFIDTVINLGNKALDAAHALAQDARPWWTILHVPFQYICVLIAIDKSESLAHLSKAMEILERITRLLGTHLALEALSTAKLLIKDSAKKRGSDLKLLEEAYGGDGNGFENVAEQDTQMEFNWDEFFGNDQYNMFPEMPLFGEGG